MRCPVCGGKNLKKFSVNTRDIKQSKNLVLLKCRKCEVIFAENFHEDRSNIYGETYAAWGNIYDAKKENQIARAKQEAFKNQIKHILKLLNDSNVKALDVGAGNGYLMECLEELKFEVWGTEISFHSAGICEKKFPGKIHFGKLEKANYPAKFFDVVFLTDVLEHISDPKETMKEIGRILKDNGYVFIISPNYSSITRKIMGGYWFQYKYEHIFYYNKKSLAYLLNSSGFRLLEFKNNRKKFSLSYYYFYFGKYSLLGIGKFVRFIYPHLPEFIQNISFSNPLSGEFLAIAQKYYGNN